MFRRGKQAQQKSLFGQEQEFSPAMNKMLKNSWAGNFFETIYLAIREERFAVLYSKVNSRPNAPVNMLVSLLLIKEINQMTDEQLIEALAFDFRFHHALGIENIEKERICINTLTHFRKRLVAYEVKSGEDLLQQEFEYLINILAQNINMQLSMGRMDSMMISSSCKKLTRLELVYTVIHNMIRTMHKIGESIPEDMQGYLESHHRKSVLYQTRTEEAPTKTDWLFQQADQLYRVITALPQGELQQTTAFLQLKRLLEEQCIVTEEGVHIPVTSKEVAANSLQNPSDADATFRTKRKDRHIGYVANLVEVRDQKKKLSLIMHHEVQTNTHSDAQFGEDFITKHDLVERMDTLVADGAYYRADTVKKADERQLTFAVSAMTGGTISAERIKVSDFTINKTTRKIECCPAGKTPLYAEYQETKNIYRAKFAKPDCEKCPLLSQCPIEVNQEMNTLRFTEKKLQADKMRSRMKSEEYRKLANFRAGVEGIPSVLRRVHQIDQIPSRGLARLKIWVHCKIMAYNVKQLLKYALSPLFLLWTNPFYLFRQEDEWVVNNNCNAILPVLGG
jgi:hypothetical protein